MLVYETRTSKCKVRVRVRVRVKVRVIVKVRIRVKKMHRFDPDENFVILQVLLLPRFQETSRSSKPLVLTWLV